MLDSRLGKLKSAIKTANKVTLKPTLGTKGDSNVDSNLTLKSLNNKITRIFR